MQPRQTYFAAEVWHGGEDQTGGEEAAVYVERTDANEVGILVRFVADDGDRPSIYLAPADAERLAVAMLRAAVAPWEAK